MSGRVRRRKSKVHRLALLTPWQRWARVHGTRSGSAIESPADWQAAYALHRDSLLAELDDPAESFRGFWRHDDAVPDELREDLRRAGHDLLPPDRAAEYQRRYAEPMQRRRDWLHKYGHG